VGILVGQYVSRVLAFPPSSSAITFPACLIFQIEKSTLSRQTVRIAQTSKVLDSCNPKAARPK
jgi:hypothetical protein